LPHVAALAGGGFVVAWDSYVNDPWGFANSDIFFQRFDAAGHAVGAVTQANVASGGGHDDADVAALSDGSFLVAWQGADGDGNGIFGRRFDGDGNAIDSQEFGISQLRSGDQASADVTALAGGEADLTRRLEVGGNDELATISDGFNRFVAKIQDVMAQVRGSSGDVAVPRLRNGRVRRCSTATSTAAASAAHNRAATTAWRTSSRAEAVATLCGNDSLTAHGAAPYPSRSGCSRW
ncbi:HAMP domain-containing protein, partial [Massilia sp. CT11-108]|uniref:HAMP domain-containing protein n=1 Tax=Massilia sp. CT11-108 TaxID=3393900 RepID=UPI0039A4F351